MEVDTRELEKLVIGIWDGGVTIKEVVDATIKKGQEYARDVLIIKEWQGCVIGHLALVEADQMCKELELTGLPFPDDNPKLWTKIKEHKYFKSLKYVLEDHDEFEWDFSGNPPEKCIMQPNFENRDKTQEAIGQKVLNKKCKCSICDKDDGIYNDPCNSCQELIDKIEDLYIDPGTNIFMKALFKSFRSAESASQLYEWCDKAEPLYDKIVGKDS